MAGRGRFSWRGGSTAGVVLLIAALLGCGPQPSASAVAPDEPAPPPRATPADHGPEPAASAELDAATLAAMAREASGLNALVHPAHGMFLIHNIAGPVAQIEVAQGWPDIESDDDVAMVAAQFDEPGMLATLRAAEGWEAAYRAPGTDGECDPGTAVLGRARTPAHWVLDTYFDAGEMSDEGGVTPPPDQTWLDLEFEAVAAEHAMDELGYGTLDEKAWAQLRVLDAAATRAASLGSVTLYFGRFDGRWYLVGFDGYDDACG